MAEEQTDESQKTEDPTQKKLEDSRKKGQVASSREVNNWIMILAGAMIVLIFAPGMSRDMSRTMTAFIEKPHAILLDAVQTRDVVADLFIEIAFILLVPMAIPGVLFALSWTLMLSPKVGALNMLLRDIFSVLGITFEQGPINIYSLGGLIFLDGVRGVTTVFLMVVGSFRMMDPSLEEAARVSKAGTFGTFMQVTLPAMLPAVLAAGMYSFISSMESFEAPLAVGLPGGIFVLSTLIYFTTRIQAPMDYGLAAVFGISYMILMLLLLVVYRRAVRHSDRFSTITGKGFRPRVTSIGKWRYPALAMFILYFLLAVAAPFAILLWASVLPRYRVPSWDGL